MKKTLKKAFSLVLCMSMAVTLAAVSPETKAAPKAKKITLNAKKQTLTVGEKFKLKVKKVKPAGANKKVTWKTSNKKVVKVSKKGVVTAKAAGSAKVTATSKANKKVKAVCKVTVTDAKNSQPTASVVPNPTQQPDVTPTKTPRPTPTPFELPEDAMKDYASFNVGTVVNRDKTLDKSFTQLAAQQFDVVSFENEMKGYSLIDVEASKAAVESEGESVVKCQFGTADDMVKWAQDNGLQVRGHVLFWEQSMANAFFYKGYNVPAEEATEEEKAAALVDAETLKARMESYANQVISHFEEKFPGEVIAWDVVNEAINADSSAAKDETTKLYLNNDGNFYKILGGEYIKYAFEYAQAAKKAANADINLFYNDFNCFQSPKTDRIVDLIKYLNSDENNKLLDCMGMEGYVLTYWPSASEVKSAMEKFADLGVKVGINELCIRLSPQYSSDGKTVTDADIAAHVQKCADMFKVYCDFNKAHPDTLTNVSIWALFDRPDLMSEAEKEETDRHYDYNVYGTHSGLFDENYKAKDAFNRVIEVLKESV